MKETPIVSTIIVSFNTCALTCQAVESVLHNYRQDLLQGEVIIVDNHSTDDSVAELKKRFGSDVEIIQNEQNKGFSGGNNLGIKKSSGKFVFLLNSDTILHDHAVLKLLEVFSKYPDKNSAQQRSTHLIDRVGIVSGKLLNPDGSLQKQGGALPSLLTLALWWLFPLPVALPLPANLSYHVEQATFFEIEQLIGWLGGTALMVKREVFEEIGLLDEGIFMYAEDVEFCLRATDHHFDIVYTPHAKITHFGSASSSSAQATLGEVLGLAYVSSKHFPAWKSGLIRKVLRLGSLLRWVLFGILLADGKKKKLYQEAFQNLQLSRNSFHK